MKIQSEVHLTLPLHCPCLALSLSFISLCRYSQVAQGCAGLSLPLVCVCAVEQLLSSNVEAWAYT